MISINKIKKNIFNQHGFQVYDIFDKKQIINIEIEFYNQILLQAFKLGIIKTFTPNPYDKKIDPNSIHNLVKKVNKKNKKSIDFAIQSLRETPGFYRLVNNKVLEIISKLLNCPETILKIHFDGILVNIPGNKKRLYKFHSESHYYPYRKNFVNLWMPIIVDKNY